MTLFRGSASLYVKYPMSGGQRGFHHEAMLLSPAPILRHAPHQRVNGAARLRMEKSGLADLYQRAPCRLLFPDPPAASFPEAVMVTTCGGLTGGDRIQFDIDIGTDARASIIAQAAEKLYRVLPDDPAIQVSTRIDIATGGRCEYLAQEAILFDGAALRRSIDVSLAADARALIAETLVFGRCAMGETMLSGRIHDAWRIRRDGRLVWADALHLDGAISSLMARPFAFGDALAMATIVYAGPDAAAHIDLVRQCLHVDRDGVTCHDGLLIMRMLDAEAAALRLRLTKVLCAMREAALDLPNRLPAIWYC